MFQIQKVVPNTSIIDKTEFKKPNSLKIGSRSKSGWVVKIYDETVMICFSKKKDICLDCGFSACKFSCGKER